MPLNRTKQKGSLISQMVSIINAKLKTGQLGRAANMRILLIDNKNNISALNIKCAASKNLCSSAQK